ncbi:hypothetical protein DLR71_03830 [Vibrio paracholerae]|nr:hypothetical protein DLR71_03830 [Vibrio paracholerae]
MTSPLMKFTLQDRDTLHELDQPLKELAYVSNHWGPLLNLILVWRKFTKMTLKSIKFVNLFFRGRVKGIWLVYGVINFNTKGKNRIQINRLTSNGAAVIACRR